MENLSLIHANIAHYDDLLCRETVPAKQAVLRRLLAVAGAQLLALDPYASETDPERLRQEAARCLVQARRMPVSPLRRGLASRGLALAQRAEARDRQFD